MPKFIKYKKDAVIYFQGERSDEVYLVNEGVIILIVDQSETTIERKKKVGKGEFFGLYSSIGKFPRQENAISLSDVELIILDDTELEALMAKKPDLSLQLMRMLSHDLRVVHKKSQNLLGNVPSSSAEEGLYAYIEMYIKNDETNKAKYVINKFLEDYSDSDKIEKVKELQRKL